MQPATDYAGRRHARITRSMKGLHPALLKVLTVLRYRLRDGETQPISNAEIARETGYSDGYVSALVRCLAGEAVSYFPATRVAPAHPFISRASLGRGRGHDITMLPPPELRPKQPKVVEPPTVVDAPAAQASFLDQLDAGPYSHDPFADEGRGASERDELPRQGDHGSKGSILLDTNSDQQQQAGGLENTQADDQEPRYPPRPPQVYTDGLWHKLLAKGVTVATFHAAAAVFRTREGIRDPYGAAISALLTGTPIRPAEPKEQPDDARPARPAGRSAGRAAAHPPQRLPAPNHIPWDHGLPDFLRDGWEPDGEPVDAA